MQLTSRFFSVGVNNVQSTSITATYPNPAKAADVISTAYSLKESSNVTLRIFNSIGQLVAVPMNNSPEVQGEHTFQWNASELSLAPGTYITELTAGTERSVQKVVIQ
jgi:hypothetical protein